MHKIQINLENSHESLQQKQIFLTKLIQKSGVQINGLDHTKKGAIKMNFYRMLGNLNSILLGQYLMKTGLSITKKTYLKSKTVIQPWQLK